MDFEKPEKTPKAPALRPRTEAKGVTVEPKHLAHRQIIPETLITRILDDMAEDGISIKEGCRKYGIIEHYRAVLQRISRSPTLAAYDVACREQYMKLKVRQMNEIALDTNVNPERAKLVCDNIKWEASRILPHMYGDRIIHAGDKENPIVTKLVQDSSDLMSKIRQPRTIENGT